MNSSTFKILLPIVLLMAVIFAVTYFSQYTPQEQEEKTAEKSILKPLRFFSMTRIWNPRPDASLMDQNFPGFYEPSQQEHPAAFWFENRNDKPVIMQLDHVSCSQCSSGQVATIPAEITKQILQTMAISALPLGMGTGLPLALETIPATRMASLGGLDWQHHRFNQPRSEIIYRVPPAPTGDPWVEPWSILQLNFQVKLGGRPLKAAFVTRIEGTEDVESVEFNIGFEACDALYLSTTSIDLGELNDSSPPQDHEIIVYSPTRTPAEMGTLSVRVMMPPGVSGEPGPFISTDRPIPLTGDEITSLAVKVRKRVRSAFRIPVHVNVKEGQNKLDIGVVERNIAITQGTETKQVEVRGSMRGPVHLGGGAREINFGVFAFATPQTANVVVETDRSGLELEIVPRQTQPKFLRLELTRQPDIGDRGIYRLKAVIPANEQLGEIRDGVVVLQTRGPNPQKLRIPVRGRGRE